MTVDDPWAAAIEALLSRRKPGVTVCPSEVARQVAPDDWRQHMDDVRAAAWRLVDAGRLEVTQRGEVVRDRAAVRGPIRLRFTGNKAPLSKS